MGLLAYNEDVWACWHTMRLGGSMHVRHENRRRFHLFHVVLCLFVTKNKLTTNSLGGKMVLCAVCARGTRIDPAPFDSMLLASILVPHTV